VESEQVAQYNFYLRTQTRLKLRRKVKHMFHFPSQSHYPAGLLTIASMSGLPPGSWRLVVVL